MDQVQPIAVQVTEQAVSENQNVDPLATQQLSQAGNDDVNMTDNTAVENRPLSEVLESEANNGSDGVEHEQRSKPAQSVVMEAEQAASYYQPETFNTS